MKGVLDGLRAPGATRGSEPGDELKAVLRPYQRDGVRWLWWAHELGLGVCLADDMGLGKTLAGARAPSPAQARGGACAGAAHRAGVARRQLDLGGRALRAEPAHSRGPRSLRRRRRRARHADSPGRKPTARGRAARRDRRGHHDVRHGDAHGVAARARMGPRRARRGAGDQEPGSQADARREGGPRPRSRRADRHARREPARRSLVALRLPRTRACSARATAVRRRRRGAWPRARTTATARCAGCSVRTSCGASRPTGASSPTCPTRRRSRPSAG